jgi:hypothetical protein
MMIKEYFSLILIDRAMVSTCIVNRFLHFRKLWNKIVRNF